jgi:hypothetical protein
LLLAIVAGAIYQLFAVKYLEINYLEEPNNSEEEHWTTGLINNPGIIYNLMLLSFGIGVLLLTITAVRRSTASPSQPADQVLCSPLQQTDRGVSSKFDSQLRSPA